VFAIINSVALFSTAIGLSVQIPKASQKEHGDGGPISYAERSSA